MFGIKWKTSCRSGIPDLDKGDGSKTKTDSEKMEVLNNFFKSIFTTMTRALFTKLLTTTLKLII